MSTNYYNFISWAAQVFTITTAAALLLAIVRNRHPRFSITFCYICLASCFVVPLVTQSRSPVAQSRTTALAVVDNSLGLTSTVSPTQNIQWETWLIVFCLVGYAVVVGRSLLGLYQIHRLRKQSRVVDPLPESVTVAAELVQRSATVCVSDENAGPVTFGLWRPIVLIPRTFFDLSPESQRSVICHELVHVRRRDWLVSLVEEGVRSLLWFQPAVWYLLSQTRLAREQLVDAEVVQLTAARQAYVDALLMISGVAPSVVTPALLGQRHLSQRLHFLLSQPASSRLRTIIVAASMMLVIGAATVGASSWFPLTAPLQAQVNLADGAGVSVDPGGSLLHRTAIFYPWQAAQSHLQGTVLVKVSLNAAGEVTDASILSGPEEFRKEILAAVLQWHYVPEAGTSRTVQARIDFTDGVQATPPEPAANTNSVLESIDVSKIPNALRTEVWTRIRGFKGQPFSESLVSEIENIIAGADSHLSLRWAVTEDDNHTLSLAFRDVTSHTASPAAPLAATTSDSAPKEPFSLRMKVDSSEEGKLGQSFSVPLTSPAPPGVQRVGFGVSAPTILYKVNPAYPPDARAARINGKVVLEAIVQADGTVKINRVVRSLGSGLDEAAVDALTQWRFNPATRDGVPVPVALNIEVNFNLR